MSSTLQDIDVSRGVSHDYENEELEGYRKLRISGSSTVLTIPQEMLDAVGFEEGDQIRLSADFQGDEIRLRKAGDAK